MRTTQIDDDQFNAIVTEVECSCRLKHLYTKPHKGNVENSQGQSLLAALLIRHDHSKAGLLCNLGVDLCCISGNGHTPLTDISSQHGDYTKEIRFLCGRGVSVNAVDLHNKAAVHHAAANNNIAHVECLLSCGANIDIISPSACTPLMFAAESGHVDCMRVLLAYGAEVNWIAPGTGDSIADSCFIYLMTHHGATTDDYMPILFDHGLHVDITCNMGSLFLIMIMCGSVKCSKDILERGSRLHFVAPHPMWLDIIMAIDLTTDIEKRSELNEILGASGENFHVDLADFQQPHPVVVAMATNQHPTSLREWARKAIRWHLSSRHIGPPKLNLLVQVRQLPLPPILKKYLWFS